MLVSWSDLQAGTEVLLPIIFIAFGKFSNIIELIGKLQLLAGC